MDDDIRKEIEAIIGGMECPKDFQCYRSGLKVLCKARDFGIENYLECLETEPQGCCFSISFGDMRFCKCPLRYYLVSNQKNR